MRSIIFAAIVATLVACSALAQQRQVQTTEFTRSLLRGTNAAAVRDALGFGTNSSLIFDTSQFFDDDGVFTLRSAIPSLTVTNLGARTLVAQPVGQDTQAIVARSGPGTNDVLLVQDAANARLFSVTTNGGVRVGTNGTLPVYGALVPSSITLGGVNRTTWPDGGGGGGLGLSNYVTIAATGDNDAPALTINFPDTDGTVYINNGALNVAKNASVTGDLTVTGTTGSTINGALIEPDGYVTATLLDGTSVNAATLSVGSITFAGVTRTNWPTSAPTDPLTNNYAGTVTLKTTLTVTNVVAPAPTQAASTVAGYSLAMKASDAVAATSGVSTAVGGSISIRAGAGAAVGGGAVSGGTVTIQGGADNAGVSVGASLVLGAGRGTGTTLTGAVNGNNGNDITITGGTIAYGPSGTINITGATNTGTGTSRAGGPINILSGPGGTQSSETSGWLNIGTGNASPTSVPGATAASSAALSIYGGRGGNATSSTGGTGGSGTSIILTSGAGGNATGASGTRTGGGSGTIVLNVQTNGTGATANGAYGTIDFRAGDTNKLQVTVSNITASVPVRYTAMVPVQVQLAPSGGTNYTLDLSTGQAFFISATNDVYLSVLTNTTSSQSISLWVLQDTNGNRSVTFNTNVWKFAAGSAPVATTNAGAFDLYEARVLPYGTNAIISIKADAR